MPCPGSTPGSLCPFSQNILVHTHQIAVLPDATVQSFSAFAVGRSVKVLLLEMNWALLNHTNLCQEQAHVASFSLVRLNGSRNLVPSAKCVVSPQCACCTFLLKRRSCPKMQRPSRFKLRSTSISGVDQACPYFSFSPSFTLSFSFLPFSFSLSYSSSLALYTFTYTSGRSLFTTWFRRIELHQRRSGGLNLQITIVMSSWSYPTNLKWGEALLQRPISFREYFCSANRGGGHECFR